MACFNATCQQHNSYFQPLQRNHSYLCLKDLLEELCSPADQKAINVLTFYSWVGGKTNVVHGKCSLSQSNVPANQVLNSFLSNLGGNSFKL